jgi:hypothetical protein
MKLISWLKKKKSAKKKTIIPAGIAMVLMALGLGFFYNRAFGEQSGSSPTSSTDSRLKQAYDWLVAKGTNYGSATSLDWTTDWGSFWNRIAYAATWEPDGDAAVGDVLTGKTFYAGTGDRTIKTGTAVAGLDYSPQSLIDFDDASASDPTGEESTWTNPATNVWKDGRTGLYWSNSLGNYSNNFSGTHSLCDFFTTTPRGNYAGGDSDCGNAINACGTLSLTSGGSSNTDWYLPSQKELLQAVIDGMYNQAGSTFTTTSQFWSSTEYSGNNSYAWTVFLNTGWDYFLAKTTATYAVRCVRRD